MSRSASAAAPLIDLSPRLSPATRVWPGDQPLLIRWTQRLAEGHSTNLSAVTLTPHLGAHADAPLHLLDRGADASEMSLHPFLGPALVVDLIGMREVTADALGRLNLERGSRLLLRTRSTAATVASSGEPAFLTPDAAECLVRSGVILVGVDTPSVDAADDSSLPVHRVLLGEGVAILEGLELGEVEPGRYELIALPLALAGVEASPVRAVLRPLGPIAGAIAGD